METVAIIAYRQPITRAEIEHIRGVDSIGVLGSLLEKQLIRILGRKEVPGRPLLYGTTQEFLELFGLKNLKSMPTLKEIGEMLAERTAERKGRREEETAPSVVETTQHAESGYTDDTCQESAGLERTILDPTGAGSEEEKDLAEGEITAEEMDEILKEARAKYRSVKKAVGIEESVEEDLHGKGAGEMDETER
jgi:hypothetical protein